MLKLKNKLLKKPNLIFVEQKLKLIDYYENKLNDSINSLKIDYPEVLSEIEMEETNKLISYFLHGLYRITMPPLSIQYPRYWMSNTKWNSQLQPTISELKKIREELESELLKWGDTWLQLANLPQSQHTLNDPVKVVTTSKQRSPSPTQ